MLRSTSALTSAPIFVSRILALCPVVRSRNLCAALLLPLALFALLTAPATHAQAVSGNVVVAPVINTFAGTGAFGGSSPVDDTPSVYNGDDIAATSANLNEPWAVAVDSAGNLYIADFYDDRVRMVAAKTGTIFGQSVTAGDIYTVAGNGTAGYSGDGGPATLAEVDEPLGVAVDSAGNLYIADFGDSRIRMVAAKTGTMFGGTLSTTAGDIYTVADNGTNGYSGDGGLATNATLNGPDGLAVALAVPEP